MWALFFGFWYALYYGCFWWYIGLYTPFFILLALGSFSEIFIFLAVIYNFFAVWIYFPTYAHEWRVAKLRSQGFNYDGDIEARSAEEAISNFKKSEIAYLHEDIDKRRNWFWKNTIVSDDRSSRSMTLNSEGPVEKQSDNSARFGISKGTAIIWAIATLTLFLYFIYGVYWTFSDSGMKAFLIDNPDNVNFLKFVYLASSIFTLTLTASYLVYGFKTNLVADEKKVLWVAVLLIFGAIVMPFFWYHYVWKPINKKVHT